MIKPYLKSSGKIKKVKTSTLRNKADRLYQELGRKMYSTCFCGKEISCLHHYHPKSTSSGLRYEIKNGVPICAGCHIQHHAKNDPDIQAEMILFMKERWGDNWEIELRQQRQVLYGTKTNSDWYLAHIENLTKMINTTKEYEQLSNSLNW